MKREQELKRVLCNNFGRILGNFFVTTLHLGSKLVTPNYYAATGHSLAVSRCSRQSTKQSRCAGSVCSTRRQFGHSLRLADRDGQVTRQGV